ncbi:nitroreductase family protein [Marinomonas transparens]|uniref:Nitroreductase family protein n=1 Tax=Marinomonas transparens TaxID=2795388 RepID=A0A934JUN2_9GAMM|nr:nitroreductase family protein [Marinomonas transparens]MBJ7538656.1 nitroreductase family protein [Marinomonas transparens]
MNTLDTIQARRSIKQFDKKHLISDVDFQTMIKAGMLAPTSFNIQHWRFLQITDKEKRRQLQDAAWGQVQVTEASELLIITANTKAWDQQPERYWKNTTEETRDTLVNMLKDFYRDREWLQRDEAIRSGAMAAQNIMLAATELGYQTSPMIGFDMEKVSELIRLPENHVIVMMLAIGKGTTDAWPRGGQLELDEVLIKDHF